MTTADWRLVLCAAVIVPLSSCEKPAVTSPSAADPILGTYTLTLSAGSECTAVPEVARHRTYTARITGIPQRYVVTLSDATFATDSRSPGYCNERSGLGCNQFTAIASPDGAELHFQLVHNSERLDNEFGGYGGTIVELIGPDARLEVYGRGSGRVDALSIAATVSGNLWYCSPIDGCDVWERSCQTTNLQLSFTRR
jgi:hypothetical protein